MNMIPDNPCIECGFEIPSSSDRCPHCGRPSLFPNIIAAKNVAEIDALEKRYREIINRINPAILPVAQKFETVVSQDSHAVIARYATEVFSLAANDKTLYASFYELVQAGARLPAEGFWDKVRAVVDEKLFPYYKQHIRFAALSLDGQGLSHYGDCFFMLKDNMIAHRATVFEENSVVYMQRLKSTITDPLPVGFRAIWQDRGRLAVVKLAGALALGTTVDDFPALLLSNGKKSEDDQFVEVHIYGSITIHSVAEVSMKRSCSTVRHKALREKLDKYGIPMKKH